MCPTSFCTPVPSQGNQGHACSPPGFCPEGAEHHCWLLRHAWVLGLFLRVAPLVFLSLSVSSWVLSCGCRAVTRYLCPALRAMQCSLISDLCHLI